MLQLKFPQETIFPMIDQDIAIIALLLFAVLYVLLFPGGPGTPRRFKHPWVPVRVNLNS